MPLGSPNLDPVSNEQMSFPHPFSEPIHVFRPGGGHKTQHTYIDRNYVIIAEIRTPTKRFLKL